MTPEKYVKIIQVYDIQTNRRGDVFRKVTFKDIQNNMTIRYFLFEDSHNRLWNKILNGPIENKILGEIKLIKVTSNLLEGVGYDEKDLTIEIGDEIKLFIWCLDGWSNNTEEERIKWSFNKQIYKYRKDRR